MSGRTPHCAAPCEPGRRCGPPTWLRLLALGLLLVGLWALARGAGWLDGLDDAEALRQRVQSWGAAALVAYLALFALGELLHVPGMVFVAAAPLLWGPWLGTFIALLGSLLSVSATFAIVRTVGGRPLSTVRWPMARRLLARLDRSPVLTIALLRCLLWLAPPLNYALAMTAVRFRDYVLGSAIGLLPPVVAVVWLVDALL
ncbi:MAG: VTT domain-containing protein [Myxococcales bacterium]|nr:VTT domain-containing protein [Myxococcales bacterium]